LDRQAGEDYIYLGASQLKGNMIVIALEPKSMLGLVTYKQFAHLLKAGEKFPILRGLKNNKIYYFFSLGTLSPS